MVTNLKRDALMAGGTRGIAARLLAPVAEVRRGQAGIGLVGNALSFGVPAFAALNTGLVFVWLVIVTRLEGGHREREQPAKAAAA